MGRSPCCEKKGLKKGPWTPEEDQILISYIQLHGHGNWRALPEQAGLLRCGKSCRLRWINYLQPDIKRGNFTAEEEETIMKMHEMLGNRWSAIAAKLSGRTDNEIKNHWRTHLKKRLFKNTIDTNATNKCQIRNSLKDDSRVDYYSLSTKESAEIMQRRQHSEQPSQTVATNATNQTSATNATSIIIVEDGVDRKNLEVLNDDFWADVLSESSFSMGVESGFEVQSLSSLSAPSMGDVTTISQTWWLDGGDNLNYSSVSFLNNV